MTFFITFPNYLSSYWKKILRRSWSFRPHEDKVSILMRPELLASEASFTSWFQSRFYIKNGGTFLQINWQKSTIYKHFPLIHHLHLGNFSTFPQFFRNYFVVFYNNFSSILQSTQNLCPPHPPLFDNVI